LITSNDTFRQIITDAVSLAFAKNLSDLEDEVKSLREENKLLHEQIEMQEQYSRRNCLLIHGIPAKSKENTDEQAKTFFQEHLGIQINDDEIDRSHRLGKASGPIIVKLVRHNTKHLLFSNKKKLKGKKYLITESLTAKRKEFLKKMKDLQSAKTIISYWNIDGQIWYTHKNDPDRKIQLSSLNAGEISHH